MKKKQQDDSNGSLPEYAGFYPVIAPLIMCHGVGDGKTTSCVMAQAATINALRQGKTLDAPTDEMECACPVLRRLAIRLNDGAWWADDMERTAVLRPLIPLLLDSRGDVDLTLRRVFFMADKAVRELTPMRLEWVSNNAKNEKLKTSIADGIRQIKALKPITSKATASAAREVCSKLRASAYADADAYASAYAYADADAIKAQRIKYRDSLLEAFRECAAIKPSAKKAAKP